MINENRRAVSLVVIPVEAVKGKVHFRPLKRGAVARADRREGVGGVEENWGYKRNQETQEE